MLRLKNIHKKHFLLLYFTLVLSVITQAQIDADIQKEITYPDFIKAVAQNNIAYAAEKLNINIAEANIEKSKIIPDPEFTADVFNNDQHKMKMGYGYNIGLDWTSNLAENGKHALIWQKVNLNLANIYCRITSGISEPMLLYNI
ncbi:hypothetical protein [Sphingobacterium sp. IITKGP-BTPF85]|uniref:hypothetical protein n=1 Tax=Sphingobacterium sp. IITKGP-BTPF85 TaxID=1338009 RepID=UPI0003FE125F|nr:hypothetical protein [Sphingobacterium sp. IITKGP-BTPF85]KKX46973.1 hypothetical protein L950_0228965 [Sphingobacterium sp. IITKGP-BTPF85]